MAIVPEEQPRICMDCGYFHLERTDNVTEFGICGNDPAIEPFTDEIVEDRIGAECRAYFERKKFSGNRESCADFEEIEELDDAKLSERLGELAHGKPEDREIGAALLLHVLGNKPVDDIAEQLAGGSLDVRRAAIDNLSGLIAMGNREAMSLAVDFFKNLPPPSSLEEVHFKILTFEKINHLVNRMQMIPILVDDLLHTRSDNATRLWISAIFRFLESCPANALREPLRKVLESDKISYRIKRKVRDILTKEDRRLLY